MFTRLRSNFGVPGVIAVFALVFAMFGGAYAASGGLTGKQKKEVKGIAKQFAGKQGAPGATGPAGLAGSAGPKGDTGATGQAGQPGEDGEDGAPGKGATVSKLLKGQQEDCEETGGALVKDGQNPPNAVPVCNGEEGEEGPEGSPWTAGGKLPPGATETGTWSFSTSSDSAKIFVPISFTIPAKELAASHVHFQDLPTPEAFAQACPAGEFGWAEPSAKPGELCVYHIATEGEEISEPAALFNAGFSSINPPFSVVPESAGAGEMGAMVVFNFTGDPGESATGFGTWAVTGCGGTGAFACP